MGSPDETPLQEGVPDTADMVDPTAPDPTPDEVTDPSDPNYVEPDPSAVPVTEDVTYEVG